MLVYSSFTRFTRTITRFMIHEMLLHILHGLNVRVGGKFVGWLNENLLNYRGFIFSGTYCCLKLLSMLKKCISHLSSFNVCTLYGKERVIAYPFIIG